MIFVSSSAWDRLIRVFSGSVRTGAQILAAPRDWSSTRMGKRPCISGIRSAGLERWKAPDKPNGIFEGLRLHANCFVSKPVDVDEFLSVVRSTGEFWLHIVKLPG